MTTVSQRMQDSDVDEIVEALVADPTCAEDVKALLKQKLAAPDVVRMIAPKPTRTAAANDEADDMWDNVPV